MSPTLIRTLPWSLPLALVVIWEIVCRVFATQQFILPAPSAIVATTIEFYGAIAQHARRRRRLLPQCAQRMFRPILLEDRQRHHGQDRQQQQDGIARFAQRQVDGACRDKQQQHGFANRV